MGLGDVPRVPRRARREAPHGRHRRAHPARGAAHLRDGRARRRPRRGPDRRRARADGALVRRGARRRRDRLRDLAHRGPPTKDGAPTSARSRRASASCSRSPTRMRAAGTGVIQLISRPATRPPTTTFAERELDAARRASCGTPAARSASPCSRRTTRPTAGGTRCATGSTRMVADGPRREAAGRAAADRGAARARARPRTRSCLPRASTRSRAHPDGRAGRRAARPGAPAPHPRGARRAIASGLPDGLFQQISAGFDVMFRADRPGRLRAGRGPVARRRRPGGWARPGRAGLRRAARATTAASCSTSRCSTSPTATSTTSTTMITSPNIAVRSLRRGRALRRDLRRLDAHVRRSTVWARDRTRRRPAAARAGRAPAAPNAPPPRRLARPWGRRARLRRRPQRHRLRALGCRSAAHRLRPARRRAPAHAGRRRLPLHDQVAAR